MKDTKERDQEILRAAFRKVVETDIKDIMKQDKLDELRILSFKKNDSFYQDKIYNDIGISEIKPKLIFCETKYDKDIWDYYRSRISCLRSSHSCGRVIKILVQDSNTQKYIGILSLSSDFKALSDRDNFIGWDNESKLHKLKNIINISCCVPLQPFGYNTNGGKLMAAFCFSKEVCDYYKNKYGDVLAGLTTTSIYGKSIQYDRLPFLKLVGFTKGFGDMHIPIILYNACLSYCNKHNIDLQRFNNMSGSKLRKLGYILKEIGLDETFLVHNKKRGIYFGYTHSNSKEWLCDKSDTIGTNLCQSVSQIYSWWVKRWAEGRVLNLSTQNRIKQTYEVIDTSANVLNLNLSFIQQKKDKVQLHRAKQKLENKEDYLQKQRDYIREYRNKVRQKRDIFVLEDGSELRKGYSEIYKLTNTITGKCYVGKCVQVLNCKVPQKHGTMSRWKRHVNDSKKIRDCAILPKSIVKYGADAFVVQCLCVCMEEHENELEKYFINFYNTISPNGYNIQKGGEGNYTPSGPNHHFAGKTFDEEYRNKLSKAHSGENHHFYGKSFCESHRKALGHGISISKREYDDQQFLTILRMKKSYDTTEEISKKIKDEMQVSIDRNTIVKIWSGKVLPIDKSVMENDEYKELVNLKRKRVRKSQRILTDDQILKVLDMKNQNLSTCKVASYINETYKVNVHASTISDVWNKKLIPSYLLNAC